MSHATHANAALTPRARLRLARLIVDQGWPIPRPLNVTTCRGGRLRSGQSGIAPMALPGCMTGPRGRTTNPVEPRPRVRQILHLRWKQRARPDPDRRPARDAGLDRARGAGAVSAQSALPRRPRHRRADPSLRTRPPRRPAPHGRQEARPGPRPRRLAVRGPPAGSAEPGQDRSPYRCTQEQVPATLDRHLLPAHRHRRHPAAGSCSTSPSIVTMARWRAGAARIRCSASRADDPESR